MTRDRDLRKEYLRAIIRRISRDEKYYPGNSTMQKYGLSHELINKIRRASGFPNVSQKRRKLYEIYTNLTEFVKQHKAGEELSRAQERVNIYKRIVEDREQAQVRDNEASRLQRQARPHVDKIEYERMTIDDMRKVMLEIGLHEKTAKMYSDRMEDLYEFVVEDEDYETDYHRFMSMFKTNSASTVYNFIKELVVNNSGNQNPSTLNAYIKPLNWIINNLPGIKDYLGEDKIKQWKKIFNTNKEDELQKAIEKTDEEIDGFQTIQRKVASKYGKTNIYYLLLLIFDLKPMRNSDYPKMILKKNEENLSNESNYLILNKDKVTLIFNQYKQSNKKGSVRHETTSKEISLLIKTLKLPYDKKMFPQSFDAKLKKVLLDSGVDLGKNGVYNALRKSTANTRPHKEASRSATMYGYYKRKLK